MIQSSPDGQHIAFNQRFFRVFFPAEMVFGFHGASWVNFYLLASLIRRSKVLRPIRCRNFSIKAANRFEVSFGVKNREQSLVD